MGLGRPWRPKITDNNGTFDGGDRAAIGWCYSGFVYPVVNVITWVDLLGKTFLYTLANWFKSSKWFLDVDMKADVGTMNARLYDITADAAVAQSEISSTDTSTDRVRSIELKLENGHEYKVQGGTLSSDSGTVSGADLINV